MAERVVGRDRLVQHILGHVDKHGGDFHVLFDDHGYGVHAHVAAINVEALPDRARKALR